MASTVSPRTYRSYCSVTQLLSARPGEPIRASRSARSAGAVRGPRQRGRVVGQPARPGRRAARPGGRRPGRRPRRPAGCPRPVSPCQRHDQPAGVGHLADDRGPDVPLGADVEEPRDVVRLDDRHHPLLRLAHQDLGRPQRRVAQRHRVELDVHAAGAGRRQLGGRAGTARPRRGPGCRSTRPPAKSSRQHSTSSFSVNGIAHLDARPLRGPAAGVAERRAGQHRGPADAVRAGRRRRTG